MSPKPRHAPCPPRPARRTLAAFILTLLAHAACSAGEDTPYRPTLPEAGPADASAEPALLDSGLDDSAVACQSDGAIVSVDPDEDWDHDGWAIAQGDCNDCDPSTNPGAFDVAGSGSDEDCSGGVDDEPGACDGSLDPAANEADDGARALGLCRFVEEFPSNPRARRWGVLSARWRLADGTDGMHYASHGVLPDFGPHVHPQEGSALLALSTGTARRPGDLAFQPPAASDMETSCAAPEGWPKSSTACPSPLAPSSIANDSASLELRVRAPTNARSVSFRFSFYTAEFPAWVCNQYDDFFVALLGRAQEPESNVSFDGAGNPISVNGAFLEVCSPQVAGGKPYGCLLGNAELVGTGFEASDDEPRGHAATGWLETTAPVIGGETISLRLMVWDGGDHLRSSTVLIDGLRWDVTAASDAGTVRVPSPK